VTSTDAGNALTTMSVPRPTCGSNCTHTAFICLRMRLRRTALPTVFPTMNPKRGGPPPPARTYVTVCARTTRRPRRTTAL
jgi:hypothetical protein